MEKWRIIGNFPDYVVSDEGRVRRICKDINNHRLKVLTPLKNKGGYLYIRLYKNKNFKTLRIHRLVLEAFKPNEDLNKTQCNHKNGTKSDNQVENLEWCTASQNVKHAFKIGLKVVTKKWKREHSKRMKGKYKGENNPFYGKHHSKENKKRISDKMKGEKHYMFGKHLSEETKKKKSEKMKGEKSPNSKLFEKDIVKIKIDLREGKLTQKQIAKKFNIDQSTISLIKNKKIWSHITLEEKKC